MEKNEQKARIAITAVFIQDDSNGFMAYLSEIPEVATEGDTLAEAEQNLFELLPEVLEVKNEIIEEQRIIHGHGGNFTKKTFEFLQV